jgi:hypothetical protein
LTLSKSSFLISITRRQQVAEIQGKPIYVIAEVSLTPVKKGGAEAAVAHTRASLLKGKIDGHADDSESEDEEGDYSAAISDDVDDDHAATNAPPGGAERKRTSSVAEDVMAKKGGYGRFAQKWFSKKGWTVGQRRNLGLSVSESEQDIHTTPSGPITPKENPEPLVTSDGAKERDVAGNLLPKLLRTTQILFGSSRSFFFSYDYDITRSISNRRKSSSELPLHKEVDPL